MAENDALVEKFLADEPTVLHKFDAWVQARGEADFFHYGEDDRNFTYREFDRFTNRIANALRSLGVGKGDRVSLLSVNGLVSAAVMFASWKIGGVYCPINNRFTGDLLAYVIEDTRPKLLIVDQQLLGRVNDIADRLGANAPPLIVHMPAKDERDYAPQYVQTTPAPGFKSSVFSDLIGGDPARPSATIEAADFSSIIYTSGTTGNPKGVVHRHAWLHNISLGLSLMTHPDDVLYCDLPLYHIGGAFANVVRAAWSGASIAVWNRFSTSEFWPRIHKSGATITLLLDVMNDWIMQQPPSAADRENTVIRVHMQPLPDNHFQVSQRFGFDFVAVGYGSTELGLGFTGLVDEFGDGRGTPEHLWKGYSKREIRDAVTKLAGANAIVDGSKPVPKGFMGRPVGLFEPLVLDREDRAVRANEPGQLVLKPKLPNILFAEYFNKPEATREAIKGGAFHSSDIVSYDENGAYYFKDRKQGFIRVRGENVAATVVEAQLNTHPKVSHSAVVAVPAQQGAEDDIAAFVVPDREASLDDEELRSWTQSTMPKFMWPRHIRIVSELPVTPTMKIEKYKLKKQILKELKPR